MKRIAKTLILVATLAALTIAGFLLWQKPQSASATWWNDSWLYRQAIPVVNNTSAETDVYISLTLDTNTASTSMQTDCGDFRFTTEAGEVLPYYLVSGCQSVSNVIHVNFNIFPAGAQTVYFYYGNPSAENGFSTADFSTEASNYTIGTVQSAETGPGPVGYWSFDEGYGATAHDESGQGNDGTITGAVWRGEEECVAGKCLWFDGESDAVAISNFQFPISNQFSISQFINLKTFNASSTLIGQWGGSQNNILVGLDSTDPDQIRVCVAGTLADDCSIYAVTAQAGLEESRWHNLQIIYDGSQSGNVDRLQVYIDGQARSLNFTGTIPASLQSNSSVDLKIGSLGTMTQFSNAQIDEVKIYPYVRSADQVKQDYAAGLAGVKANLGVSASFGGSSDKWMSDGLVGYWKFDEADAAAGEMASYRGDYSTSAQGNNGWYYQRYYGSSYSNLVWNSNLNNWLISSACTSYSDGSCGYLIVSGAWVHPSQTTGNAVISWLSDFSGQIYLDTTFSDGNSSGGDGVRILVLKNTTSLYDNNFSNGFTATDFNGYYDVEPGDYMRIMVDRRSTETADATSIWFDVYKYPEVSDSSGLGNGCMLLGNASSSAGKFGHGMVFDGSGDYASIGQPDSLDIDGQEITLSSWVYAASSSYGGMGILHRYDDDSGWRLHLGADKKPVFSINGSNQLSGNTALAENIWYFVTATYDGEKMKLYVNGEKEANEKDFSGRLNYPAEDAEIGRGDHGGSSPYYFQGQLDEVRIYNRALSPDEVRKLYEWAPGPVAHWRFDELSGTTAYDSVASSSTAGGNDGTISGAAWTNGKYGGALSFDGSNSVLTNNSDKIQNWVNGGNLSTSMWFKHNDLSVANQAYLAFRVNSNNNQFIRYYSSSGDIRVCQDINGVEDCSNTGNLVADTDWHHLSLVIEGTSNKIYLDGIYQDTLTLSGSIAGMVGIPRVGIGNDGNNSDSFDGLIDDVRIYNYARTQKQIFEDMYNGKPGPILHLSFDEGRGDIAYDSSIYGNNGTLSAGGSGGNTTVSAMWDKGGKYGGAMEFDGDSDTVAISNFQFPISNQFSISQFFNFQTLSTGNPVISQWASNQYNILVKTDDASADELKICLASGLTDNCSIYGVTVNADLETGVWYNLQIIFDGALTGNDKRLKVFINGEQKNLAFTGTIPASAQHSSSAALEIGGNSGLSAFASVKIDELKIYSFALNLDEIKTEYNHGSSLFVEEQSSADNNGTTVTGAATDYCVPGDTAQCDPPVLELKFDELSGTTTYDTSGNGNDGVFVSSAASPSWTRGKTGGGLQFDGTDDYIPFYEPAALNLPGEMSAFAWVKFGSVDGGIYGDSIFGQAASGGQTDQIEFKIGGDNGLREPGKLLVGWEDTNINVSNTVLQTGRWYHVGYTRSGASGNWTSRIYIDGILDDETTGVVTDPGTQDTFSIGRIGDYNGYYLNGLMDDVKIYNYARTPAQIAYDYNKGKPAAHWRFDECSGGVIHDESGNGNHGTLNLGASGVTAAGTCASSSDSFWYNGRSGKYNSGGSFDGEDDRIDLPALSIDFTEGTISAWIYSEADQADWAGIVLNRGVGADTGLFFDNSSNDELRYMWDGAGEEYNWSSGLFVPKNQWVFIAIVAESDRTTLYLNSKSSVHTNVNGTADFVKAFWIGDDNGVSEREFDGQIDEVKIFNYALTVEQVKMEYNGGAVRFGQ